MAEKNIKNKNAHFAVLVSFTETGKETEIKIEDRAKDFDQIEVILLREGEKLRVFSGSEGHFQNGIHVFYETKFVEMSIVFQ